MGTVFYNCNNRDSAGAELKKHAALSSSQPEYKMYYGSELFSLLLS